MKPNVLDDQDTTFRLEDLKPNFRARAPQWSTSELDALRAHAPELEHPILDACTSRSRPLAQNAKRRVVRKMRDLLNATAAGELSTGGKLLDSALTKASQSIDDLLDGMDDEAGLSGSTRARGSVWMRADGTPVRVLAREENFGNGGMPGEHTVGDFMRAMVGKHPDGTVRAALSEGTDSAGGYTVPTYVTREFIDKMRAKQVCVQAGARTVQLETAVTKMARIDTDPTASWRSENGAMNASDPVFSACTFTARSLYALVKVSMELLEDSVNIAEVLDRAIINALAVELDRACLFGSGTPPEPQGVFGTSGIGSVSMGTNGLTLSGYSQILSTLQALEDANVSKTTAMVAAPRTKYKLAGLIDTTNQPLMAPAVVSAIPLLTTSAVPLTQTQGTSTDCSTIIAGDFTQMLIGLRSDLRLQLVKERFLTDNGQIGFLATMRCDVQLEHPAAFAKLIGIRP